MPQPYLGNPENCSVITLNLNPGPTSNLRTFGEGILVNQLSEKENYFQYAKDFPQMNLNDYPSKFWNKQFNWINRITNNEFSDKLPFAIEICPWHSKKWKALNNISPQLLEYIKENVFDVIDEAINFSSLKTVLSVGKTYYNLFSIKELGFEKVIEISPNEHSILDSYEWPKNKEGKVINRHFSIWKHRESDRFYFNTYAPGSNTPPSKVWNKIQSILLEKYTN